MNEKQFNKKLRKNFERIRILSFEACGLAKVPDMFCQVYTLDGLSFWMEGKVKANANSPIPWRPGQEQWASEFIQHRGIYFVICFLSSQNLVQIFSTKLKRGKFALRSRPLIPASEFGRIEEALLKLLPRRSSSR